MEKIVKELEINGCSLEESLFFKSDKNEFWHSTILDQMKQPISGGFGVDRLTARKIAIAEYLERATYRKLDIDNSLVATEWGLNQYPTACGFAAGFSKTNTIHRSVCEAAERWVMSQWIDGGFYIPKIKFEMIKDQLDDVSLFFYSQFDRVEFYEKTIEVKLYPIIFKVRVALTIACLGNGVYPGSSAQIGTNIWQHALLESYRHLLFVRNNKPRDQFPDNKIFYFSINADKAITAIGNATKQDWLIPELLLSRCESFEGDSYFVARTILKGWNSWHDGPLERFLY